MALFWKRTNIFLTLQELAELEVNHPDGISSMLAGMAFRKGLPRLANEYKFDKQTGEILQPVFD